MHALRSNTARQTHTIDYSVSFQQVRPLFGWLERSVGATMTGRFSSFLFFFAFFRRLLRNPNSRAGKLALLPNELSFLTEERNYLSLLPSLLLLRPTPALFFIFLLRFFFPFHSTDEKVEGREEAIVLSLLLRRTHQWRGGVQFPVDGQRPRAFQITFDSQISLKASFHFNGIRAVLLQCLSIFIFHFQFIFLFFAGLFSNRSAWLLVQEDGPICEIELKGKKGTVRSPPLTHCWPPLGRARAAIFWWRWMTSRPLDIIKAQSLIICVFWACFSSLSLSLVQVCVSLSCTFLHECVCQLVLITSICLVLFNNRCSRSTWPATNYGLYFSIGQPFVGAQSQFTRQSHQPLHHSYQVGFEDSFPFSLSLSLHQFQQNLLS